MPACTSKPLLRAAALYVGYVALLAFFCDTSQTARQLHRSHSVLEPIRNVSWSAELLYSPIGQSHDAWRLLPRDEIAPLTAEVQEFLFSRQFPAHGCANQRFLIGQGHHDNGFGAHLHVATFHLSTAIELDRIFLWGENTGQVFVDPATCPVSNFECFFRAPSSCTLRDAYAPGANFVTLESASTEYGFDTSHVPLLVKDLWYGNGSRMLPSAMELKYWWRAQAVAFLARLNDATLQSILKLRRNVSAIVHSLGSGVAGQHPRSSTVGPGWDPARRADFAAGARMAMAESFPFERGMTSIHVRHGDKAKEMDLVQDEVYFAAAEKLVMHHPMSLIRAAFISSEDPQTIIAAAQESRGWAMLWYDIPRVSEESVNPSFHVLALSKVRLVYLSLLQLLMALECDAWIGTRRSNWNRYVQLHESIQAMCFISQT